MKWVGCACQLQSSGAFRRKTTFPKKFPRHRWRHNHNWIDQYFCDVVHLFYYVWSVGCGWAVSNAHTSSDCIAGVYSVKNIIYFHLSIVISMNKSINSVCANSLKRTISKWLSIGGDGWQMAIEHTLMHRWSGGAYVRCHQSLIHSPSSPDNKDYKALRPS